MNFNQIFSLRGKRALIVGGGGLGAAIAQALMQNGADLVIADRKGCATKQLQMLCDQEGRSLQCLSVDLLDEESISSMVTQAASQGRIDVLVNAAGINIDRL